jgi:nitrite reductase/ring-hydroxylating ferredoxin subunit
MNRRPKSIAFGLRAFVSGSRPNEYKLIRVYTQSIYRSHVKHGSQHPSAVSTSRSKKSTLEGQPPSMLVSVGSQEALSNAQRHVLTFRRAETEYLCLVLFHLAEEHSFHAMINECPHLGASMEDAAIAEIEDEHVVVCPLHAFDFNLQTGEGSSGLSLCVYPVVVEDGQVSVDLEPGFSLVSSRAVSQTFPSTAAAAAPSLDALTLEEEPKTLTDWARLILLTSHPTRKVELTRRAASLFRKGKLKQIGHALPPDEPPRESLALIEPGKGANRGKGGSLKSRIALLHSLANIEQWAIDLAWVRLCSSVVSS